MSDPHAYDAVRAALDAAARESPPEALPHLRLAAERLAELIDESMAEALLDGAATLRATGSSAGLSENAVGPRLARTRRLGGYADAKGRVTAAGIERARYDAETGTPPPAPKPSPPMRFKPRRTSS